jgi:hypothetical protein
VHQNRKIGSKLELSLVSVVIKAHTKPSDGSDNLRQILLGCMKDASDIAKEAGIHFSTDVLYKSTIALFIQRIRTV